MPDTPTGDAKLVQFLNEAYTKEKQLENSLQAHVDVTTRDDYAKDPSGVIARPVGAKRVSDAEVCVLSRGGGQRGPQGPVRMEVRSRSRPDDDRRPGLVREGRASCVGPVGLGREDPDPVDVPLGPERAAWCAST